MQDMLRALDAPADQIARVPALPLANLRTLEETLTRQTISPGYRQLRALADHLGLPEPFAHLPTHPTTPEGIATLGINGFGPSSYAFENWQWAYADSRGLNPGVDYLLPAGSPLIAVADGVIVEFPFLSDPAAQSLALRPYLPAGIRRRDGSRAMSNVIVGYGHLSAHSPYAHIQPGTVVQAGEHIGLSGYPVYTQDDGDVVIQHNDAHLHFEVHILTDGDHYFRHEQPFNPLLFFAPELVAFQARLARHTPGTPYPQDQQPYGKPGFFTLGCFRRDLPDSVWEHAPSRRAVWPEGVYDQAGMIAYVSTFEPYTV